MNVLHLCQRKMAERTRTVVSHFQVELVTGQLEGNVGEINVAWQQRRKKAQWKLSEDKLS